MSGVPAESLGVSHLDVGEGRVWSRRIDVLGDDRQQLERVLEHELAHVVLADRFCNTRIPHWADEAIATLSENGTRVAGMRSTIRDADSRGDLLAPRDILSLRQYPRGQAAAELFYAQSASLIGRDAENEARADANQLPDPQLALSR